MGKTGDREEAAAKKAAKDAEKKAKAAERAAKREEKVDDPSQSARAFYVSSPEPKD